MSAFITSGPQVPDNPRASILIPVGEDVVALDVCLESLRSTIDSAERAEFLIVANGTGPEGLAALQRHEDVVLLRSRVNLGLAGSYNLAARHARSDVLCLLRPNLAAQPQWLHQLTITAARHPDVGAVGSAIEGADAGMVEAGRVIWRNGAVRPVGPTSGGARRWSWVREVDAASGEGLLVRRSAWDAVGGMDETFFPAEYEDADLCMALRSRGLHVMYEPRARVRRLGTAHPTRFQLHLRTAHQEAFVSKWRDALEAHDPEPLPGPSAAVALRRAATRSATGRRILISDDAIPDPALGSGFVRTLNAIEELVEAGYCVTMVPTIKTIGDREFRPTRRSVMDRLCDLGVDVRDDDLIPFLAMPDAFFDAVIVSRPLNHHHFGAAVRRFQPQAPLIYDMEAMWHRRMEREAELAGDTPRGEVLRRQATEFRGYEQTAICDADHVVAITAEEAAVAAHLRGGSADVSVVVMGRSSSRPTSAAWRERSGCLFTAGWLAGRDSPNLVALRFFVDEILGRVRERVPWFRLLVTGANPPDEALEMEGAGVTFLGHVPTLQDVFGGVVAVCVPMLTGAGVKIKTVEALLAGVPTVSTSVGAEGIDTEATGALLVHDDPARFASALVQLLLEEPVWEAQRQRVLAFCEAYDSAPEDQWADILTQVLDRRPAGSTVGTSRRAKLGP